MGLQTFGGLSLCLGLKVLVFVLSAVYPGITWVGLKGFTAFKKVSYCRPTHEQWAFKS